MSPGQQRTLGLAWLGRGGELRGLVGLDAMAASLSSSGFPVRPVPGAPVESGSDRENVTSHFSGL